MALKPQTTRDAQTQVLQRRTQDPEFLWGGMVPDDDPAAIPPNHLELLINCRIQGGSIAPRGGSKHLLDLGALAGSGSQITGLADFQIGTPRKMWIVGDGCPGLSSSVGWYIGFFDVEQEPEFQPAIYYSSAAQKVAIGLYSGDLYASVDNTLRKVNLIEAPYGEPALDVSGSSQDLPLLTLTGFTKITDLMSFDGKLFIGADGGGGASEVAVWDGVTQSVDVAAINAPAAFGTYRESLVMGFAGAPNSISVRPVGVPGAAWATVAPSGGTVAMRGPGCSATYKDVFWFATGGENLYKFDGTTLTLVPVATSGIAAGSVTHSCCSFGGYLFVSYTSGGHARIARFDGTTWVPIHKDLTTQVAAVTGARSLVEYRGDLWVGLTSAGGGRIYRSVGADTSGTWATPGLLAASNNGDIDQILVY
jgi:hypothetical protein